MSMYADDKAMLCYGRNFKFLQKKMQKAIIKIEQWCKTWSMDISTQKSAAMVFTNIPRKEVKLTINDNLVPNIWKINTLVFGLMSG